MVAELLSHARLRLVLIPVAVLLAAVGCGGGNGNNDTNENVDDETAKPVAVLAAFPDSGDAPFTADLDGSSCWAQDGSALTYDWDFDGDGAYDLLDGGNTVNHTWDEPGTYNVVLRVTDSQGNFQTATTEVVVFAGVTIEDLVLGDPVAQLSVWPSEGEAPLDVTIDASGCWAQDGGELDFEYDFEGDGTYDLQTTETQAVHTYNAGDYSPTVRVTDSGGRMATASQDITVSVGSGGGSQDPVAQISVWPTLGEAPLEVTIDASGCWAYDGGALSFEYDFEGDGTYDRQTTETQVVHTYNEGTYHPTVRATDTGGRSAIASQDITVSANSGGGAEGQAPVAVLLATPVAGQSPLVVDLDASYSVALGGGITQYDWDLDGDGEFERLDAGPQATATFIAEGLHYVSVRVVDADGLSGEGQAAVLVLASL